MRGYTEPEHGFALPPVFRKVHSVNIKSGRQSQTTPSQHQGTAATVAITHRHD